LILICYAILQKKNASLQIVTSNGFLCPLKKKSLRAGVESGFIISS
jgi:hypothetical protein